MSAINMNESNERATIPTVSPTLDTSGSPMLPGVGRTTDGCKEVDGNWLILGGLDGNWLVLGGIDVRSCELLLTNDGVGVIEDLIIVDDEVEVEVLLLGTDIDTGTLCSLGSNIVLVSREMATTKNV